MTEILFGASTGIAFGAVLVLAGLADPDLIVDMLRLRDLHLLKVLVVALATGIAGVCLLAIGGLAHLGVKPLQPIANLLGGAVFGVGFAIAGYCPGTSLAAAAAGRIDAVFAVAGGVAGAGAYSALYSVLKPVLVDPGSAGKLTLPAVLGIPHWAVALPLSAGMFALALHWWRQEAPATASPLTPASQSR